MLSILNCIICTEAALQPVVHTMGHLEKAADLGLGFRQLSKSPFYLAHKGRINHILPPSKRPLLARVWLGRCWEMRTRD